jgi:threonine dehydratase
MTHKERPGAEVEATESPVCYESIEKAASFLEGWANRTPVLTSSRVFFKCENFQRAGAFKFRGAFNALSRLPQAQQRHGVLAYSSGNHAQAVALAGQLLCIPTTIVMPEDAPEIKLRATESYGAEVVRYDRQSVDREELGIQLAAERNLAVVPPYDHPDIVAGAATAARELFEEVGALDLLLVCCGGGGLLSGSAISTRALSPECHVVGVEPEIADDAMRSYYDKTLHTIHNPDTIADGARTPSLGEITYPLVLRYVDGMTTVSEEAILRAMFFLWERMKLVVEPTGALGAAALLEAAVPVSGKRVGVIISGGNIDLRTVVDLLARVEVNH